MGIEPTPSAWKAEVLPLNYTRQSTSEVMRLPTPTSKNNKFQPRFLQTSEWWRGEDSNLRRLGRQIYSLLPLAAREPLQKIPSRSTSRRSFQKSWLFCVSVLPMSTTKMKFLVS